jgi:hypothetical protein
LYAVLNAKSALHTCCTASRHAAPRGDCGGALRAGGEAAILAECKEAWCHIKAGHWYFPFNGTSSFM